MAEPWLIRFFACNREMQPFSFFFCYSLWGGDFGSGSGSKFNCAARVGSGQTISGTGRVRASVLSPCRALVWTSPHGSARMWFSWERTCRTVVFPAWQPAVLKLGVLRTFSERWEEWGRLRDCNWVQIKAHSFILFCNVYIIYFTQKWGVCCYVICTKIDLCCC